jgi:hypothetical protein
MKTNVGLLSGAIVSSTERTELAFSTSRPEGDTNCALLTSAIEIHEALP